jgi:chromosome segregation ATPase
MGFTVGNAVTIVLVLLILYIYRQLDSRNRSLDKVKRFADKVMDQLSRSVEERSREIKDLAIELDVNVKTGREALKRVREVEQSLGEKASAIETIENRINGYDQVLGELAGMTTKVDENLRRIHEESEFVDRVAHSVAEASSQLDRVQKRIPELEQEMRGQNAAGLDEVRAACIRAVDEQLGTVLSRIEDVDRRVKDYSAYLGRLEARSESVEREGLQRMRSSVEELELRLKGAAGEVAKSVEELVSSNEVGLLQKVEARFHEHEGELEYRFKKLQDVHVDIGVMEKNLRDLMATVENRVTEEFRASAAIAGAERAAEKQRAETEIAEFWARHQEIEEGLATLKSKAYQDVSEKLKVFEDDFFADLRKRSEDLASRLSEWQAGLEERMQTLGRAAEQDRQAVEERYAAELAQGLGETTRSALEAQRKIEVQLGDFESQIRGRIEGAEDTIRGFEESLKAEIERTRAEALGLFRKQVEELHGAVGVEVEKTNRDATQALARQAAEMEAARKELLDLLEATKAEVAVGQARIAQQLKESESDARERAQVLKGELDATVASLKGEFAAQRDDLVVGTNEERMKLRNELDEIAARTRELHEDLGKRSEGALGAFRKDLESFEIEHRKRSNEFQAEVEKRVRSVRALVDGVRDKAEATQQKAFGKIEEGYNQLSVGLDDLDKRLKGFTAQTRIFERADNLRIVLEGSIDTLKTEMANLQAQRKELHDMETQLLQTRRLAEDVSQKLNKFAADRRRIDDMDEDFRRLLSVSREIDMKLQTVTASHDALEEVQARIRSLEDLEQTVEARFDRLEKKKTILDSTAEGVQKNFQSLESLESSLESVRPQIAGFAGELAAMRDKIGFLEANKGKTDLVVSRMSEIDGILGTLEDRIGKLQTAREWLARTETRFEEVGKQAQDQVRLLETLVKSELPKGRKEEGAPPRDKRETVVKLARQGWSAAEIARVTHLSRGEVELILELQPKTAG